MQKTKSPPSVKWCWEMRIACEIYANNYSGDTRKATESESDKFIEKCRLKIGSKLNDNDIFPQATSSTSTSSTPSSFGTAGSSSNQSADSFDPISPVTWKIFQIKLEKALNENDWAKILNTLE